ncbi:MAG TPA: hypothetical protein VNF00_02775 [Candidatus Acidoferrales bacterium]|nr:hypothetical protein [Candidatus Acidoferrales bacterium]
MRKLSAALNLLILIILSVAPLYAQKVVPVRTAIMVRLNQNISSKNATQNEKVKAAVAQDVVIHGKILIPRGSPAAVYVAETVPSGQPTPSKLYLRLDAVTVGGRAYPVSAYYAGATRKSPKKHSEATAAGGAAGAGAGIAGAAATGKEDVSFVSATVLRFRLKSGLTIH